MDKILIYDLGSTDNTVKIIKTIKNPKISLRQFPRNTDLITHAVMRQKMLDETEADWVLILDGDEIWPDQSIKHLTETVQITNAECIVVPTLMLLGDVFHFQESVAGDYHIAGKIGHYNLRAFPTKIPGLHVEIHPNDQGFLREGFFDEKGKLIYERGKEIVVLEEAPYLHASHLRRSSRDKEVIERVMRFKYEIGNLFDKDFKFPNVFYAKRPKIVPSSWKQSPTDYKVRAFFETPLKKLRRRLFR